MVRLLTLALGALTLGMDAYVTTGILPAMSRDLHSSTAATGLSVTAFTLAYALLAPAAGPFVARVSHGRTLVAALAILTVGNVGTALAPGLAVLLLCRAVAGIGAGVFIPGAAAAAAAGVPADRHGRALATVVAGMATGAALGVPVGVAVASILGTWRATLWLVVLLGSVAATTTALVVRPPKVLDTPSATANLREQASASRIRPIRGLLLVSAGTSLTSLGSYTYLGTLLHSTPHTGDLAGYLWAWGLGGLVSNLVIGIVMDRVDTRLLATGLLALLAASILAVPFTVHTTPALLVDLFLWGMAGWGALAPSQHRLIRAAPEQAHASLALNASALYLGAAAGAALIGALVDDAGTTAAYGAAAATAAAIALANLRTVASHGSRAEAARLDRRPQPAEAG